jgi:hypothetical protein
MQGKAQENKHTLIVVPCYPIVKGVEFWECLTYRTLANIKEKAIIFYFALKEVSWTKNPLKCMINQN